MPELHTCPIETCPCRIGPLSDSLLGAMSEREYEVFGHLGMGLSNQEIARRLFISERTVKAHVGRLVKKLGCETRTAAALAAQLHLLRVCPFGQLSYAF